MIDENMNEPYLMWVIEIFAYVRDWFYDVYSIRHATEKLYRNLPGSKLSGLVRLKVELHLFVFSSFAKGVLMADPDPNASI